MPHGLRRNEIVAVVQESIGRQFDRDVADVFDLDDLDNVGRLIQERGGNEDKDSIDRLVESVATECNASELDALADGNIRNPNAWLYEKLAERLNGCAEN